MVEIGGLASRVVEVARVLETRARGLLPYRAFN